MGRTPIGRQLSPAVTCRIPPRFSTTNTMRTQMAPIMTTTNLRI